MRPLATESFATIAPSEVRWLWSKYIPLGAITKVEGEGAHGKSTLLGWLAARVSRGDLPGDLTSPSTALWLNLEEHLSQDIRPRLDRQGADVSRVLTPLADKPVVRFPRDLDRLRDRIVKSSCRLVVIDQVMGFMSAAESVVREVATELRKIAEDAECAIVISRNLNGKAKSDPYRGGRGGSLLTDIARSNLIVTMHPDDVGNPNGRRLLVPLKINVTGRATTAIVLAMDDSGRIGIGDELDITPAEALGRPATPRSRAPARDAAVEFLERALDGREVATEVIMTMAGSEGHSRNTIDRARAALGVRSRKVGPIWMLRLASYQIPDPPRDPTPPTPPAPRGHGANGISIGEHVRDQLGIVDMLPIELD